LKIIISTIILGLFATVIYAVDGLDYLRVEANFFISGYAFGLTSIAVVRLVLRLKRIHDVKSKLHKVKN